MRESGTRVKALENKPQLHDYLIWVWNAFHQLSSTRNVGMAVGPIPWDSLDQFAQRHGIEDEDQFENFRHLITVMDSAYLEHIAKISKPAVNRSAKRG